MLPYEQWRSRLLGMLVNFVNTHMASVAAADEPRVLSEEVVMVLGALTELYRKGERLGLKEPLSPRPEEDPEEPGGALRYADGSIIATAVSTLFGVDLVLLEDVAMHHDPAGKRVIQVRD